MIIMLEVCREGQGCVIIIITIMMLEVCREGQGFVVIISNYYY